VLYAVCVDFCEGDCGWVVVVALKVAVLVEAVVVGFNQPLKHELLCTAAAGIFR